MDEYTLCEESYKNGYNRGYEQGKKDAMRWHGVDELPETEAITEFLVKLKPHYYCVATYNPFDKEFYYYNTGWQSDTRCGERLLGWMEIPE